MMRNLRLLFILLSFISGSIFAQDFMGYRQSNYSGVKNYRDHTGIGPMQLNNIEPPNVIEKIDVLRANPDNAAKCHAFSDKITPN